MGFSTSSLTRRRFFQGASATLGAMVCSRAGFAEDGSHHEARAVVGRLVDQILQLISSEDRRQERRLMTAIEKQTDLTLLARMTMGRHWRRANARQQDAFVDIFGRYLLNSFATRLKRYASTNLDAARDSFTMISTQNVGKRDVVVQSRVTPPSGSPLRVDWRLRSRGGRLVIIDLVVEGVSLLITQRSEFGAVLERIGIDGLIVELQKRVAQTA